jgi:hypothetical protein
MCLGIIYLIYDFKKDGLSTSVLDILALSLNGAFFGAVVAVFPALMLPVRYEEKHYSLNIVALQDNASVNGRYFLGSGYIEGNMKYMFYYEDNGYYRMMQLDTRDVQIQYSEGTPKVNATYYEPSESIINYFAFYFESPNSRYIIEVPRGTIQMNYTLDAK